MLLLTFFIALFLELEAGLAPTWDSCQCRWDTWSSWSSCTETCGGGTQYRDRSVWHLDIPECDGFEKCASNDMGYQFNLCNAFCDNGGTLITISERYGGYCLCPDGKTGSCCETTIDCGTPSSISNGRFDGTDFTYNQTISYVCNSGYNMTDPTQTTRRCTQQAVWSGVTPTCLYAESCLSTPCQNNGTCENRLGYYICQCQQGWDGSQCHIDIQPPVADGCPTDISIFTNNLTSVQTWIEPVFADPHGFPIIITKNYQESSYEFPWGEHTVQYAADKPSNGRQIECIFNITVKPFPCDELSTLANTVITCNGWMRDYARVCKMYCIPGYYLPIGLTSDTVFTCAATGSWYPKMTITNCEMFENGFPANTTTHDDSVDCSTSAGRLKLGEMYIHDLQSSSFNQLCVNYPSLCHPTNVDMIC